MYVVRRIASCSAVLRSAGINHFVHPSAYVRIVPPWLASSALLDQITGICEMRCERNCEASKRNAIGAGLRYGEALSR